MQLVFNPAQVTQRLDEVVAVVTEAWFPPNLDRLRKIQSGLRSGVYVDHVEKLIEEVRSDFALFTYCLRELLLLLKEDDSGPVSFSDPIQILRSGGLERMRPILLVEEHLISQHTLTEASAIQAGRFLEAMTSATAAEMLATSHGVDGGTAYTAALMRQLGYALIAWNYPEAYKHAVESVRETGRLDVAISQALGFPPNLLGLALAKLWGLPEELCSVIGQSAAPPGTVDPKATRRTPAERISYLCLIGEALARANDPDHYPSASADWDFARGEIRDALGPDGVEKISDQMANQGSLAGVPELPQAAISVDAELRMAAFAQQELNRLNPFVIDCPQRLRHELEGLYRAIVRQSSVKITLQRFMKDVLPSFPWGGGWIYTIDPHRNRLVARNRFGKVRSDLSPDIDYLPYSTDVDIINRALRAKHPMLDQQIVGRSAIIFFAGAIGMEEPVGVLYLEAPSEVEDAMRAEGRDLLKIFQAVAKGLTDCLELSRAE